MWDARPHVGDRVTVIGAGRRLPRGLIAGRMAGDVELVDVNPQRASCARARRPFAEPSATDGPDVVVHASGSASGLAPAR
jgi:hypothetical protein